MDNSRQRIRNSVSFPPHGVIHILCLTASLLGVAGCRQQPRIRIVIRQPSPVLDFAAREVAARLQQSSYKVDIATGPAASAGGSHAIVLNVDASTAGAQPEGFELAPIQTSGYWLLRVTGHDLRGALWGALETADQIISAGRLEAVPKMTVNRFFPIRASRLPLPLLDRSLSPAAKAEARDLWRQHFDLLARNRFNAIFLQTAEPLVRFVDLRAANSPALTKEAEANVEWLHDLFRMARDRGLDAYLLLRRPTLEGLLTRGADSPEPSTAELPSSTAARSSLGQVLPTVLETYPELAGVGLEEDVVALAGSPENRSQWLVENFLAPLAQRNERRPVFLWVTGDWRPFQEALGDATLGTTIRLLAPFRELEEIPTSTEYPILWQVEEDLSELRPWHDPTAVRTGLGRIGTRNSLGFVESVARTASELPNQPQSTDEDWFRLMLWGRMAYSLNVSDEYWPQQFAGRFGNRAGPAVYAAAARSNQVLGMLKVSEGDAQPARRPSDPPGGLIAAGGEFPFLERRLLQLVSDRLLQDFVTDALRQRGLLLEEIGIQKGESPLTIAEAMEQEARLALSESQKAARYAAWRSPANQDFYRRIQSAASRGLSHAAYLRAAAAMAQFTLDGREADRQQAVQHLQQALVARQVESTLTETAGTADNLSGWISRAIEFSKQWQPWQWERITWQVGVVSEWQRGVPDSVPLPARWQNAQTSGLSEFGLYGKQRSMSTINQQLHPAFLPLESLGAASPGSVVVGKTLISLKREGRLVVRVLSNEAASVWLNRRRANRLPAAYIPWVAPSPPPSPFQVQLFSVPAIAGDNELIVAAAAKDTWPRISVQHFLAPEVGSTVRIAAREAARLEPGLVFVPGSGDFLQPHIALRESRRVQPPPIASNGPSAWALYRFRIAEAGFYRLRLWCYWQTAESRSLDLSLDGVVLKTGLGAGDATSQRWHWLPVETAADLGAGEHTLAISGWKPGARLGMIEIVPAW